MGRTEVHSIAPPTTDHAALATQLRGMLEQTSDLIFSRDLGVVDLFWQGGKFWLFGSAGEQFLTREELLSQMQAFFAKPYRERFVFGDLHVDRHGDMAWTNASTVLEVHHPDRVVRMPYRLFALFQQVEGDWRWRVFSGSEPAATAYEATTGVKTSLTTG